MSHLVVDVAPVSQFWPGKTEYACGFFAPGLLKFAGKPGSGATGSAHDVEIWALDQYAAEYGSNGANKTGGVSISDEHRLIKAAGLHYQDLVDITPGSAQAHDIALIKACLSQGYPVIATVTEVSVFDMKLGANPYWWGASGTHVLVYGGIADDGNLIAFDYANVVGDLQGINHVRDWPSTYDEGRIANEWATMVKMPWLPAIPVGYDPLRDGDIVAASTVNPHQEQAMVDCWNSCKQLLGGHIPRYDSGIAESWRDEYRKGKFHGPPLGDEYATFTWDGTAIVAQEFASGRCEWVNGKPIWYR